MFELKIDSPMATRLASKGAAFFNNKISFQLHLKFKIMASCDLKSQATGTQAIIVKTKSVTLTKNTHQ